MDIERFVFKSRFIMKAMYPNVKGSKLNSNKKSFFGSLHMEKLFISRDSKIYYWTKFHPTISALSLNPSQFFPLAFIFVFLFSFCQSHNETNEIFLRLWKSFFGARLKIFSQILSRNISLMFQHIIDAWCIKRFKRNSCKVIIMKHLKIIKKHSMRGLTWLTCMLEFVDGWYVTPGIFRC